MLMKRLEKWKRSMESEANLWIHDENTLCQCFIVKTYFGELVRFTQTWHPASNTRNKKKREKAH